MSIALRLTVVLILLLPASLLASSTLVQSCIGLGAALILACVAFGMRAADVGAFRRSSRDLRVIALIPAAWIFLQLIPLPIGNASIWALAEATLKRSSWGHGTIDIGQTSLALLSYVALVILTAVATILSLERQRARTLLLAAHASLVIFTTGLIGAWLIAVLEIGSAFPQHARDGLGGTSIMALILTVAVSHLNATTALTRDRLMSVGAIVISLGGLAIAGRIALIAIAALGLGMYAVIMAARRIRAPRYATWIALASLLALTVATLALSSASRDAMLPFGAPTSVVGNSAAYRALADAGKIGTGAGTYQSVMPIYAPLGETDLRPPSTVIALGIELGLPAMALMMAITAVLVVLLINGALRRTRDAVFPLAAAACVASVAGEACLDASLITYPALPAALAIIMGIGFSQRLRRSTATRR